MMVLKGVDERVGKSVEGLEERVPLMIWWVISVWLRVFGKGGTNCYVGM